MLYGLLSAASGLRFSDGGLETEILQYTKCKRDRRRVKSLRMNVKKISLKLRGKNIKKGLVENVT